MALVATALATRAPAEAAASAHVLLVCSGTAGCPHTATPPFRSLQAAVDHATNGDWILIWPGTYKESVTVDSGHGLTDGLHIRGMQRNGVVFDGTTTGGSAVHVSGVSNTWVENMTGEHYKSGSSNAFYWTGVDGYWGSYLTAYDNGNYGVYAYDSTSSGKTPSAFAYDYGSWNADSGIYVGGCRDCNAVVIHSKSEHNALGYSGTNAGGELYLLDSEWDHNATGILPNTLHSEPDPPQSGLTIVGNYVHDNNDNNVPGTGITGIAPVGVGIGIAGGSDDIVRNNLITNQKHTGVLVNWLFTPPMNNQIVFNTFRHVGYSGAPADTDIGLDGTSVQNCIFHNVDTTGDPKAATSDPPGVASLNDCSSLNPTRQNGKGVFAPGDPVVTVMAALNAAGVTEPKKYNGPGPGPGALATMADPCAGVPANPWCVGGKPVVPPPAHPGRR